MIHQTAVDWLEQEYKKWYRKGNPMLLKNVIEQAKEMEKEQIINARENGKWEITKCINDPNYTFPTSEQYYNETYGTN
jgi:hypothetical protein